MENTRHSPYESRAPVRVYLVEDSPMIIERLERMLATIIGARSVGHASRADEAIDAILAERPDIVMLDLHLARGNGFDVLRALHEQAPQIAIYVLSNFATPPYRQLAQRLGATDFFDKTAEFESVLQAIAERVNRTPN